MKYSFLLLATVLFAACSPVDVDPNDPLDTTEEVGASVTIPFEEVGKSILSASYSPNYEQKMDGYKSFEFTNIVGSCADQGLKEFAYQYDENLEYFVVESLDGEYRDTSVGMTAVRLSLMDKVELSGGEATCEVSYQAGNNNAEVSCSAADVEVCTADLEITATK